MDEGDNKVDKVGQEQVHELLFGEKLSWQSIIYDLINTEQLDPWDIDLNLLANSYLVKVREIEEANFFVSSKVLLAASLLLRIKSEILLNSHLQSLDDILFGKEEGKKYEQEKIELEDDIPELVPRTPIPRSRRVSLKELMSALGKAIKTENRRIDKVLAEKDREKEIAFLMPKKTIHIRDRIKNVYGKLKELFKTSGGRIAFSELHGKSREEKLEMFAPLLHLDYQQKVWLEQENHFDEVWIWAKDVYDKQRVEELAKEKNS